MKKVIAIIALMASVTAFAQTSTADNQSTQTATNTPVNGATTSPTTTQSGLTNSNANAGAVAGSAANLQLGCLVNCASTDQGSRDLADGQVTAARIAAGAAIEMAHIGSDVTVRNTPSVSGSPLVSSNDTCMGSASGAVNVPGFGIGLGKTYVDDNCMMLKNSRELWNMGMKAASLALMCNDAKNKAALELTGFECPQTTAAKKAEADRKRASAPVAAEGSGYAAKSEGDGYAAYTGNDQIVIDRLANK